MKYGIVTTDDELTLLDSATREETGEESAITSSMRALSVILNLCRDPASRLEQMAEILIACPHLSEKVIQVSNSALSDQTHEASGIRQAVVNLGRQNLSSCVAMAAGRVLFTGPKGDSQLYNRLWRHSLATGIFSRFLVCQHSSHLDPELAFVAGVLHDFAKPVMLNRYSDTYRIMLQNSANDSERLLQEEKDTYGFTHQRAGALLAQKWGFPQEIIATVRDHHQTLSLESIHGLVGLANVYATVQGLNTHSAAAEEKSLIEVLGWEEESSLLFKLLQEQLEVIA